MGHQPGFGYAFPDRPANSTVFNKCLRETEMHFRNSRRAPRRHRLAGLAAVYSGSENR